MTDRSWMKLLMAKFRLLARTIPPDTEPTRTSNLEIHQAVQGFERPRVRSPLGTHRGIQNRPGLSARILTEPRNQVGSVARRHQIESGCSQAEAGNNERGTYQTKLSPSRSDSDQCRVRTCNTYNSHLAKIHIRANCNRRNQHGGNFRPLVRSHFE